MSNELVRLDTSDVQGVLEELETAFFEIPFENSDFQNKAFVLAAQQTPARAYRSLGLKMHSKVQAVKEHLFNQEKTKIDIEEKLWKIDHPDTNDFERRRLRLEILKIQNGQAWADKLLNDALHELTVLKTEFDKFPRYTREQFEAEEPQHFDMRLNRQLRANGAQESLFNMHEDLLQMPQRVALAATHLKALEKK